MNRPLLPFLIGTALRAASIHTDFEGGSLGRVEQVTPAHYRLHLKGETDQDGRNRQANWYYFRVDGAIPGTELVLDLVNLPGEYNYKPNRGAVTGDTPPVTSEDDETWAHVERFEYDADEPRMRLRITPKRPRFWIAHTPPYTGRHLERLRSELRAHGAFREQQIGKTVGGRELLLWSAGDRGPVIWLMFRQHFMGVR